MIIIKDDYQQSESLETLLSIAVLVLLKEL